MSEADQPAPEAMEPGPPAETAPPSATPEPATPRPDRPWVRLWARLGTRPWLRPLIVIAAIVAALSLITTLVVVVDLKSTNSYAAGTPEATALSWTAAVKSGDYATADTYLSTHLKRQGSTSRSIGISSMGMPMVRSQMPAIDYSIVSSSIQGTAATVVVQARMTVTGATPFSTNITILLVQETGAWKIDYVRPQTTY